jgi:hypothetical protein
MSLNWGLSGSRATAKIVMAPAAKKQLMNVKRGSQFLLQWGFTAKTYSRVVLYWTGTIWEIGDGATVSIELVHGSWATTRTPVVGSFSEVDPSYVVKKAAKDKGVKLDTVKAEDNSGTKQITVAVSQTVAQEIERQYKGQFITAASNGKNLIVASFENLAETAQAYYISTEYGFLDKISISYKATLPKDKSYIEIIGGNKTEASLLPNSNPSSKSQVGSESNSKPLYPTYVALVSTSEVNKLQNPILNLILYVNNQEIGRYKCTSARAFLRDSRKTNNVIPDGQYTIASNTTKGTVPEVGGLFLPITPNFKTNRSALGIHFDPSFNKNNGEDGTHGCIGLITASDRDLVQKQILENKIKILIVDLNKKTAEPTSSEPKLIKEAYLALDLADNTVYAEQSKRGVINNIGSMFKLFVGIAVTKNPPTGLTASRRQNLLQSMLDSSSNTAANTLIDAFGGVTKLNTFCQSNGFLKTKLDSLYTDEIGQKQSTANDLCNAFKLIFNDNTYANLRPYLIGSSLGLAGESHTKLGVNSGFEGGISIVVSSSGKRAIVCILASSKTIKSLAKQVAADLPI